MSDWLQVRRGEAPLLVAFPHTGTGLAGLDDRFHSEWLARHDTDWWVDRLYAFTRDMGATTVRTTISRSVIDVNRDPAGTSLYPGQATTELCPTTTFDGEPLYRGAVPSDQAIARRRAQWFEPYHAAIAAELARLRAAHARVVLYDAHSIRSIIPRLFEGELHHLNVGTNLGTTCDPALADAVEAVCDRSGFSHVTNGRFRGGWTARHYGRPAQGIHAVQMELAIRGYCDEPEGTREDNWPPPFTHHRAAPMISTLTDVMKACLAFAQS